MEYEPQFMPGRARPLARDALVLATSNPGKVAELRALLKPHGFGDVALASDEGLEAPEEVGKTYADNAAAKALAAAERCGRVALADDGGLAVDALGGRPGLHTARYASACGGWAAMVERLQRELVEAGAEASWRRGATYHCVLALAWPDGEVFTYHGARAGTLVWPPRGPLDRRVDALFVPRAGQRTYAEMPEAVRVRIDERSEAMRRLLEAHPLA